jgi:hypothetical protein
MRTLISAGELLGVYIDQITDRIVAEVIHADSSDVEEKREPAKLSAAVVNDGKSPRQSLRSVNGMQELSSNAGIALGFGDPLNNAIYFPLPIINSIAVAALVVFAVPKMRAKWAAWHPRR